MSPRVQGLKPEDLDATLRPLYERFTRDDRNFTNQANVLAHSPAAFFHLYSLVEALSDEGTLPKRIIEVAVVSTSRLNECTYCIGHHGAALIKHGLSEETVEAILDDQPPGLSEQELIVRDYARFITTQAWKVPDKLFGELQKHFTDSEIVALTVRIGLCILFNKFNQALQIDMETV